MRSIIFFVLATLVQALPAAAESSAEKRFEFKTDEPSLHEGLKSPNTNTRVRSAIFLWSNFPKGRPAAEEVMEHDSDAEVRRRIAQVLASKQKSPKAIKVLKDSLDGLDIKKQSGAMSFMISASSLHEATGEVVGVEKALKIFAAPPDWFADVDGQTTAYAQKDAARVAAASYLAANIDADRRPQFQDALKAYIADVESKINKSTGAERKYWEARLPTALDIGLRVGMNTFVSSYEGKGNLFTEKYEKQRFERVLKKSKEKAQ